MAQKKNYSRYFIILNEDEKGYAISSDKLPTGYVKLEVKNNKCKVSYYVQNLKREAAPYYMILVLGKKDTNKLIKMGELNIDDFGRADVSYEYTSDNIGDTGMDVDSISGASVVRMMDTNIKPVLSGFLTSDIPKWRDYIIIEPKSREEEEVKEEINPISIFDKYEESIEQRAKVEEEVEVEVEVEDIVEDIVEIEVEDTREDIAEVEEIDVVNEDIIEVEQLEKVREIPKEPEVKKVVEDDVNIRHKGEEQPKCKVGKFFNELAKDYEEMKYEIDEIKNCVWYRIPSKDINSMNCPMHWNKYSVMYSPMINYHNYIMAHEYYLVGYKYDKEGKMKCLIYGIPGSKSKIHQPYGGKTGFVTWVPSKSRKCEGYWLMFYDFKTSTILIPVR